MALPAFRHAGRKVYNGFWPGRRIPKYKFFQNDMAPTVFITAPLFPMVSKGQTLQPSDVEGDHSRGASSTQGSAGPAPAAEPQEACATRGIKKSPGTAEDPPWGQPETPRGIKRVVEEEFPHGRILVCGGERTVGGAGEA